MVVSAGASSRKKTRTRTVYEDASLAAGFSVDDSDSGDSASKATPPPGDKPADPEFLHRKPKKKRRKKSKHDVDPASGANSQPLGNPAPDVTDLMLRWVRFRNVDLEGHQ